MGLVCVTHGCEEVSCNMNIKKRHGGKTTLSWSKNNIIVKQSLTNSVHHVKNNQQRQSGRVVCYQYIHARVGTDGAPPPACQLAPLPQLLGTAGDDDDVNPSSAT